MIDVYNINKVEIYYHKKQLTCRKNEEETKTEADAAEISLHKGDLLQHGLLTNINQTIMSPVIDTHVDIIETEEFDTNFALIYELMGPTQTGIYDKKRSLYYVEYNGLWLAFALENDPGSNELPVDLPNESSPLLKRMIVFSGDNIENVVLPPLIQSLTYFEPIVVYVCLFCSFPFIYLLFCKRFILHFFCASTCAFEVICKKGDSVCLL